MVEKVREKHSSFNSRERLLSWTEVDHDHLRDCNTVPYKSLRSHFDCSDFNCRWQKQFVFKLNVCRINPFIHCEIVHTDLLVDIEWRITPSSLKSSCKCACFTYCKVMKVENCWLGNLLTKRTVSVESEQCLWRWLWRTMYIVRFCLDCHAVRVPFFYFN